MNQFELHEAAQPAAYELLAWALTYPTTEIVADLAGLRQRRSQESINLLPLLNRPQPAACLLPG